jgi:hypothetical protein
MVASEKKKIYEYLVVYEMQLRFFLVTHWIAIAVKSEDQRAAAERNRSPKSNGPRTPSSHLNCT